MKIDYAPNEQLRWKYPWKAMRAIGDYFDVPPGNPKQHHGVRNSAYSQSVLTGYVFRTFSLPDGTVRVMLVAIEEGAIAA